MATQAHEKCIASILQDNPKARDHGFKAGLQSVLIADLKKPPISECFEDDCEEIKSYFKECRVPLPDAFAIDTQERLVTVWEVVATHDAGAKKYFDLHWFLDTYYWKLELIVVYARNNACAHLSCSDMWRLNDEHDRNHVAT